MQPLSLIRGHHRSISARPAMVKEAILCSPCLCSQYDMRCPGTNIIRPLQESTRLQRQRCSSPGRTCSTRSAVQGIEAPCITSPPLSTLHFSHCASIHRACSVCNARSDAARGKRSVQILSVLAALSDPVGPTPLLQTFTVGPVLREAVRRLTDICPTSPGELSLTMWLAIPFSSHCANRTPVETRSCLDDVRARPRFGISETTLERLALARTGSPCQGGSRITGTLCTGESRCLCAF